LEPGARDRSGTALAAQSEPSGVEEPSTLPVESSCTVAGEHSGVGPRKRCAAADEAKAPDEPMPGGPAALDEADETAGNGCPVEENAVARRLPPRVGP